MARAWIVRLAAWLVLLCGMLCKAPALAAEPWNILVLYGRGRLVQGNVDVERGLRSAIADSVYQPVRFFSEFLDQPEFSGDAYEDSVMTHLRDK